jgi:hypothetical protein
MQASYQSVERVRSPEAIEAEDAADDAEAASAALTVEQRQQELTGARELTGVEKIMVKTYGAEEAKRRYGIDAGVDESGKRLAPGMISQAEQATATAESKRAELEARRTGAQAKLAKLDADYQAKKKEVDEGAIDANRFYKKIGTGATILAAIFRGIGAVGATMGGTENFAGKIIDDAIERDLDEQKQNLAAGERGKNTLLDELKEERGNDAVAEAEWRLLAHDAAVTKAREMDLKSESAGMSQGLVRFLADMERRRGAKIEALTTAQRTLVVNEMQPMGGGEALPEAPPELPDAGNAIVVPDFLRGTGQGQLNQTWVWSSNSSATMGIREKMIALGDTVKTGNRILELARDPESQVPGSTKNALLKQEVFKMQSISKGELGPGTTSEGDWDRLAKLTGDPSKAFSLRSNQLPIVENMMEIAKRGAVTVLRNNAVTYPKSPYPALSGSGLDTAGAPD